VEDLFKDLSNGKNLLKLLEIISGEKLGKPNNGRMRVHQIENVNTCLNFLHSKVSKRRKSSSFVHALLFIHFSHKDHHFEFSLIPLEKDKIYEQMTLLLLKVVSHTELVSSFIHKRIFIVKFISLP
jgi:hypothetical protein